MKKVFRLTEKFEFGSFSTVFGVLIIASCVSDSIGITSKGFGKAQIFFIVMCLTLVITSGYVKFPAASFMRKPKIKPKELLLMICSSAICLVVCDAVLGYVMPPVHTATRYGWTVPANTRCETKVEDSPGKPREIMVEYFRNGFKRWGDIHAKKVKMLIMGDSFAQMSWVSNGEEWYSYLEKEFKNLELFVYGGLGYGSLQEFMVLDDFIDKIQPQVILLQFCGNDFSNNLYALDLMDYPYNNHGVRPYLENDRIVYRLPLPLAGLRKYSFIADRGLETYDRIIWDKVEKGPEAKKLRDSQASEKEKETRQRLEREAVVVTNKIMAMIKERAGRTPIYFLNLAGSKGEDVCRANGFIYIPGVEEHLASKEEEGCWVKIVNDGHWNKLGNELVGRQLVEYFKKKSILY